jgi:ATP-dependent protease Clp ATPase subunit
MRIGGWRGLRRLLTPRLRCAFCLRRSDKTEPLVSGSPVYICDACLAACAAVLEKRGASDHLVRAIDR